MIEYSLGRLFDVVTFMIADIIYLLEQLPQFMYMYKAISISKHIQSKISMHLLYNHCRTEQKLTAMTGYFTAEFCLRFLS